MNYLIGEVTPPPGVCVLDSLENVPHWAEMQNGERQAGLPEEACFRMSEDFPKDLKLADILDNDNDFLVVSERTVEFLRSMDALEGNDVHEVAIFNHKGRRETAKYFIVHQFDFVRCVDEGRTEGTRSELDADEYVSLESLALDESRIPSRLGIFRPREYNQRAFFRRDVAEKMIEAGITGIEFHEIDEYDDF